MENFLALFFIIMILLIPIALLLYLLSAYGMYKLAKNEGYALAWFAFIPILQYYTWGQLIEDQKIARDIYAFPIVFMLVSFILSVVAAILETSAPTLGMILNLTVGVIFFIALYLLYYKYARGRAVLYIVLSVLTLGLAAPILIFMIRNNSPANMNDSDLYMYRIYNSIDEDIVKNKWRLNDASLSRNTDDSAKDVDSSSKSDGNK